jgi:hypothetical protein
MRLQNAIENCNRTSKEMKNVLLRTNYSFNISNCDYEKLNRALKIIKNIYDYDWKIIEVTVLDKHRKSYRLILNGGKNIENFISTMRKRFYTSNKLKKVPDEILNNNTKIQESFFNGYYDGDGFRWLKNNKNSEGFDILGQVGAQGLCYIAERLGYSYNIKEKNFKSNVFTIHISKRYRRFYPGEVKYIYETDTMTPLNINSGSSLRGKFVNIWREEELEKVLFHEIQHFYNCDFHILDNGYNELSSFIKQTFSINGDDKVNESINEVMAIIIHMIYQSIKLNIDLTIIYSYEMYFTMIQIAKIIVYYDGDSYDDLFKKNENSITFKQTTSVLSYYVIKGLLLFHINETLDFLHSNQLKCSDKDNIMKLKLYKE